MSVLFERIKALVDEKNLSLRAIEIEANLSNNSLRRWDNSMPSADKLATVAKILQVSTDYLMGISDYRTAYDEWDAKYNKNGEMKNKVKEIEAVDTIAAHLEDKEITDEKIKALTHYMDSLFDKKN